MTERTGITIKAPGLAAWLRQNGVSVTEYQALDHGDKEDLRSALSDAGDYTVDKATAMTARAACRRGLHAQRGGENLMGA